MKNVEIGSHFKMVSDSGNGANVYYNDSNIGCYFQEAKNDWTCHIHRNRHIYEFTSEIECIRYIQGYVQALDNIMTSIEH